MRSKLPPDFDQIITAHWQDGLMDGEIADLIGCAASTVQRHRNKLGLAPNIDKKIMVIRAYEKLKRRFVNGPREIGRSIENGVEVVRYSPGCAYNTLRWVSSVYE